MHITSWASTSRSLGYAPVHLGGAQAVLFSLRGTPSKVRGAEVARAATAFGKLTRLQETLRTAETTCARITVTIHPRYTPGTKIALDARLRENSGTHMV